MGAKIIRVQFEVTETGRIFATSPDLHGLLVSERTMDALEPKIDEAIVGLYAACGVKVMVTKIEDDHEEGVTPWVAIPADVARRALQAQAA
jgi:hypothetical protein